MDSIFPNDPKSAVEAVQSLLSYAVDLHASDIHCDPLRDLVSVRFRVDGQIKKVGTLPLGMHDEFISRLKILSGTRTDLHTIPQDGRWRATVEGEYFNIRISFMPTYHGENAVMRILPAKVPEGVSFSSLGFNPDHVSSISKALNRRYGLILVTGPTGSGKTTTLHTCLSMKSREPLSIITLEDPVEYEIPGVRQVHIRHSHGVTFANGLRSALRQDPDVIMVGEIRDDDTAKVAIHTSLTGHLVLSTLHTNSALETIPRLVDMGIDHYLLASTFRLIVSQRLIRVLCRDCNGAGCKTCRSSGYLGRSVIAEVVEVDEGLRDLIEKKEKAAVLEDYVRSRGFKSISDDGAEKVEWGVTTKEEVLGVVYT